MGSSTPNLKLACFVCYLKIITTFKKNVCVLKQLFKELKNGIKTGQNIQTSIHSQNIVLINNSIIIWPTILKF